MDAASCTRTAWGLMRRSRPPKGAKSRSPSTWKRSGRSWAAAPSRRCSAPPRPGPATARLVPSRRTRGLTAPFLWTLQSTNGEAADIPSDEGEDEEAPEEDEDEEVSPRVSAKGFTLVFDVVRRFAQPLGIELPKWEGRIIETKKGVMRLLSVSERARQL